MSARLKVLKGENAGKTYQLTSEEFFIGRDENNDIQILDETCSRHHTRLKLSEEYFIISDLSSNNGTFVNGKKVKEHILQNGDNILIGNSLFAFENEEVSTIQQRQTRLLQDTPENIKIESVLSAEDTLPFKSIESSSVADYQAIQQKLKRLYEISEKLCDIIELPELFAKILEFIKTIISMERCYLMLADEKSGETDVVAVFAPEDEIVISQSIINKTLKEKNALLVSNAGLDKFLKNRKSVVQHKIGSVMCVPLISRGKLLGLIYTECQPEKYIFTEDDLQFLNAFAHQGALAIDNLQRYTRVTSELKQLKKSVLGIPDKSNIIGKHPKFKEVVETAYKIASANSTVLLLGETGTGKEIIARFIHEQSPRKNNSFIAINCAALVETLLESELFGYEKGAFTGAIAKRQGKFELADTGTIFLDEIGDLSHNLQAKLLRVLQEKQFYPIGGNKSIEVDVRIITATNRDIEKAVKDKLFRDDLYYRLSPVTIKLPPLRERPEDIPLLAYHFLEKINRESKKNVRGIANEAMEILKKYFWPGNIRELQNIIERAVVLCDSEIITPNDLPLDIKIQKDVILNTGKCISLQDAEKQCIILALEHTGWKKGEAAKLLGISWPTLNKKMEEYDLKNL
jgi:Nif-specific regulatory protein